MNKLAIVLGVAVALALAAPALAQAQTVIKFSHVVAPDTPKGKGSLKFKELAEKYTNGKVKVEVYPNSQLYKDNEELQALQLGAVQMLAPSLAKFGPLGVKEFEVFDLPYILPDKAALRKVTDGPLGKKLMGLLGAQGHHRPRLLGQRLQGHERQQEAPDAGRLPRPEDAHPVVEGAGGADARARRHPAGDGVLRGLSGAGDRRGRRHGEPAVQRIHPEDARGAEVHHALRARLRRLRRHHQQEVLGRTAGGHPRVAREGDGGSDRRSPTAPRRRTTTTRSRR